MPADHPPHEPEQTTWSPVGASWAPPPVDGTAAAAYDWTEHEPEPAWQLPTAEEIADLRPAQDLFLALLDLASERTLGRPLRPRVKVSPAGLLRGEVDLVKLELPAYAVAGLVVDRFVLRAEAVRVQPGLPPVLVAAPVHVTAVVSQDNVDRWTRDRRLPFSLRLTEDGIITTTGIAGFRVSEVLTMPEVVGGFIRLEPRRASVLGMPAPLVRLLRGYLPLPPLPRDATLESVSPSDGELAICFRMDRFEQPLTPDIAARVRKVFNLPLPGLR